MGIKRETPLYTESRAYILATLKEKGKMHILELSKETEMSRASVLNHLKVLNGKGLVILKQKRKEWGQPIYVEITKKANPAELWMLKMFKQLFPNRFK
jgi:DNA-binding transcriptional ArsR family regulator